jgi:hypothetical protein
MDNIKKCQMTVGTYDHTDIVNHGYSICVRPLAQARQGEI